MNCYGYNCLNIFVPANNLTYVISPSTYSKLTIVDQDMDEVFAKWLRYLKLQKYEWFFNDLSYREIELIDSDNIEMFIVKVNKNTITRGAQKKICISTKKMRDRNLKLNSLMIVIFFFFRYMDIWFYEINNFFLILVFRFGSHS